MRSKWFLKGAVLTTLLSAGVLLAGCPPPPPPGEGEGEGEGEFGQAAYDRGFDEGFAEDGEYWQGFWDGYDTVDGGTIYYTGDEIPFYDELTFRGGYWDGVWYAYNDGYFVDYDYAFTIGFSEGYDLAFASDWPAFLANDDHIEWLDGGWSDGYNDGFSEGRVFGAYDYDDGLPFDWLDALLDYRSGTDLSIGGVSTGDAGPVVIYEYGTNPHDLVKSQHAAQIRKAMDRLTPAIRFSSTDLVTKGDAPPLSYRSLIPEVRNELSIAPTTSERAGSREILLETTWLQRINSYLSAMKSTGKSKVTRGAS